jgi:hypothetical protein
MIGRIKESIEFKRKDKIFLADLKSQLETLVKTEAILTIFPQNTGHSWRGVKTAGISLFPNSWVEIPHYYSNCLLSEQSQIEFGKLIGELSFEQLVLNGYIPYYRTIVDEAKKVNPKLKVKVVYHGFLAELAGNETQQTFLKMMLEDRRSGKLDGLGFVKKGLAQTFNKMYGFNSKEIILRNPENRKNTPVDDKLNIGAFVNSAFRKNLHNMAAAAMLCDDSTLHVSNSDELGYLDQSGRINAHGFMEHSDFVDLLGKMTINLHVTLAESAVGQVCSESISQGVPCISAYTSAFFDYDDELREKLIVDGFEDSWHIYQKIEEVLKDREYLSKRCLEYSAYMNELSAKRLTDFLSA